MRVREADSPDGGVSRIPGSAAHDEDSVIRIICPNLKCKAILSVPERARGRSVRCRMCGMRVRIPALAAASSKSPAASADAADGGAADGPSAEPAHKAGNTG